MRNDRSVSIGDMIIYRRRRSRPYVGIVTESLMVGGTPSVRIGWCGDVPRAYNEEYGYATVNIHNMHTEFEVVKAK